MFDVTGVVLQIRRNFAIMGQFLVLGGVACGLVLYGMCMFIEGAIDVLS